MQLTHYYQNMINDDFRMFDRKENNMLYYNASKPPEYPLENVVVPAHLYHASLDLFASAKVRYSHTANKNCRYLRKLFFRVLNSLPVYYQTFKSSDQSTTGIILILFMRKIHEKFFTMISQIPLILRHNCLLG